MIIPVTPFDNFMAEYSEGIEKGIHAHDNVHYINFRMQHIQFPVLTFDFKIMYPSGITDSNRGEFMTYVMQNISAWLLYGEAVVNVKRPDIPITGAFDRAKGLWYILDESGERLYETKLEDDDTSGTDNKT